MHPSIALWSHPRSVSTALERSFIERGDVAVFHEPFAYVYYVHEQRSSIPHKHPDPNHPRTYSDVRDLMETARRTGPIFHKDFPYHVLDHLLADPGYLLSQVNTFLIRDPEQAVLSHANVRSDLTAEVLGYRELTALFDRVRELTGHIPPVVDAADLIRDPMATVGAYCDAVGIEFRPDALTWNAGERPEWATWKGWHTDVAASSGLSAPAQDYRVSYEKAPHLRSFVDLCAPSYDYLSQYRIRPRTGALT